MTTWVLLLRVGDSWWVAHRSLFHRVVIEMAYICQANGYDTTIGVEGDYE